MNLNSDFNSKENKLTSLKKNIISWYPIDNTQTILQIGEDEQILNEIQNKSNHVTVMNEKDKKEFTEKFDFVVIIGTFEKLDTQKEIVDLLEFAKNSISENGKILLAMQNKFGMKYWTGEKANPALREYESIISVQENILSYPRIKQILENLNLKFKFYYPLPDYQLTNVIYTDEFIPNNDSIDTRVLTICKEGEILNFSEREAYKQLVKEDKSLFPFFSNSYFIEIANKDSFEDIKYVGFSINRKSEYRIQTVMRNDYVDKSAVDDSAISHINKIANNIKILEKFHIQCLDKAKEDKIVSTYLKDAKSFDSILMEHYNNCGLNVVIEKIKEFNEKILNKLCNETVDFNNTVFEKYNIEIPQALKEKLHFTKNGLYDLIFQNCLVKNNEIFVYDQEWYEENIPIEFILYRAVIYFSELRKKEDIGKIFEKLQLTEYLNIFEKLDHILQQKILDSDIWEVHVNTIQNINQLNQDRQNSILKDNHIKNLENNIENYKIEINNLQENIHLSNNHIEHLENNIKSYQNELQGLQENIKEISNERENQKNRIYDLTNQLEIIQNSRSWKITKPLRYISWILNLKNKMKLVDRLMPPGSHMREKYEQKRHQHFLTMLAKEFYRYTDKETAKYWAMLVEKENDRKMYRSSQTSYDLWLKNNEPTNMQLDEQRKHHFTKHPKISIVVPLYNTSTDFFRELLFSLNRQTYTNWELCLADGSPEPLKDIEQMCEKDKRIKYQFLEKNEGIAGNTNAAIKLATGEFVGLLDHDDMLALDALYEVVKVINENEDVDFIYSDEDKFETFDGARYMPHFKPDFAPDTLRANNYICHFSVIKKTLLDKVGYFNQEFDGAQDFDLILRVTEQAKKVIHISKVLYHWRVHQKSTAMTAEAKPYAFIAGRKAVEAHLKRIKVPGTVKDGYTLGTYTIDYDVIGNPKVTILIPNKDEIDTLKICINSILQKTTYNNYEIVIIENNSEKEETFIYYQELQQNEKIKVITYDKKGFNYSGIINFGVKNTEGDFVVQLNNDTELLTPDWLEKMIGFAQREDVGAVGVRLYYPDETIQHAGIVVGALTVAAHVFRNLPKDNFGYFARERLIQNMNAVTAACIMTKREIYEQVDFMNEEFAVAFNDIDFCLKIRKLGKLIVYNPYVEFIHYESKSRGNDNDPDKIKRFNKEINLFLDTWKEKLETGDEYYNKNLRLDNDQYEIRTEKVQE